MTEAERVEQIYHNSSPDMLTPEGWQFLIKMARIGASVMPRPLEEAAVNEHILRFRNGVFQGCDYWYDLWKQNYQQWPDPPTHFIPLSALPKPAEVTT